MFRELQAATCKLDQYVSCLINSRREITGALLEKIVVAFLLEDKVTDSLKVVTALCFFTKQCFEKECRFKSCPIYNLSQLEQGPETSWQHSQITQIFFIKKLVIIPREKCSSHISRLFPWRKTKQTWRQLDICSSLYLSFSTAKPKWPWIFCHTIDTQSNWLSYGL